MMKSVINKSEDSRADIEYKSNISIACRLCGEEISENAKKGIVPFVHGFCFFQHVDTYTDVILIPALRDEDWSWDGKHVVLYEQLTDKMIKGLV